VLTEGQNMKDRLELLRQGDKRTLARCISMVENELPGYDKLLQELSFSRHVPLIGITGPPGAGKSTLINALAGYLTAQNKKVGIIAVDPSSPFNHGAIMGDRIRMGEHFLHENVFIRSMASRGSLGGLAPKIYEAADIMRAAGFDHIIIETVGVGQSEVEIAALADTTVLVLVPESGDEIQAIKSGIMEIADVFVVNKSDREGADVFYKNLAGLAHANARNGWEAPVVKTVAAKNEGIDKLYEALMKHAGTEQHAEKRWHLLAEKVMIMVRSLRTKDLDLEKIKEDLKTIAGREDFNIYKYALKFISQL
jgi:LAO/AO transport system kinase